MVRIPTLGHFIDQILSLFLSCSLRGVAGGVRREDIQFSGALLTLPLPLFLLESLHSVREDFSHLQGGPFAELSKGDSF